MEGTCYEKITAICDCESDIECVGHTIADGSGRKVWGKQGLVLMKNKKEGGKVEEKRETSELRATESVEVELRFGQASPALGRDLHCENEGLSLIFRRVLSLLVVC